MLYRIFKWLFTKTVEAYFRTISIKGSENIPESSPVIFVANHNSAFMDPIVLAVQIQRPLYFLARGESFTSAFISKFFKQLNMIPIYRPEVCPDKIYKNKKVFEHCYLHLAEGKTLLIFPEGFSKTVRALRPLKTGTARLALEAENRNDFQLGLQVVPIGINYSNPHRFRSHVFLNIGKPLKGSSYKNSYHENSQEAVKTLTNDLAIKMKSLLVVLKEEKLYKLVEQIETLNFNNLTSGLGEAVKGEQRFKLSKEIVAIVQFKKEFHAKKLKDFEKRIGDYFEKLKQLKIRDAQLSYAKTKQVLLGDILYLSTTVPLFVYGLFTNILPYTLMRMFSSQISVREDFVGSKKLAVGMFTFLILYVFQMMTLGWITQWYWAVLFGLSFFPSGLFCLNYLNRLNSFRYDFHYRALYNRRTKILDELKLLRLSLSNEWESYQESYWHSHNRIK